MYLSLIFLVFLSPFVNLYKEKPNKYSNFDYCTLNCDGIVHSACKCQKTPPREELDLLPYMEFRKQVLHEHNRWRNVIASGEEKSAEDADATPAAADMVVMSYDLELEYIIRCRALTSFRRSEKDKTGHDKCKKRIGDKSVGQNLYGISANLTDSIVRGGIQSWYDEVKLIHKDIIEKYNGGGGWGHFTQLIWWSTDRVGCAWVHNPDNRRAWLYSLLCNYASTIKPDMAGNVISQNVYTKSDTACSACPNGTKCNDTPAYPFLCGKQEPIPNEPPAFIPQGASGKAGTIRVNKFVVCFIIMTVYLAY